MRSERKYAFRPDDRRWSDGAAGAIELAKSAAAAAGGFSWSGVAFDDHHSDARKAE